jgi:hypothetical protein
VWTPPLMLAPLTSLVGECSHTKVNRAKNGEACLVLGWGTSNSIWQREGFSCKRCSSGIPILFWGIWDYTDAASKQLDAVMNWIIHLHPKRVMRFDACVLKRLWHSTCNYLILLYAWTEISGNQTLGFTWAACVVKLGLVVEIPLISKCKESLQKISITNENRIP